jgi:methyl-accepting chemotaxis protein
MRLLNSLRIPVKIGAAFAIVCLVIVATGAVNLWAFLQLDQAVHQLEAVEGLDEDLTTYNKLAPIQRERVLAFILTGEPTILQEYRDLDQTYGTARAALLDHDLASLTPPEAEIAALLAADEALHTDLYARQIHLMRTSETVAAARALEITTLPGRLLAERRQAEASLDAWVSEALLDAQATQALAFAEMKWSTIVSVVVTLVLAGLLGGTLVRLIARPITGMTGFMHRLSQGDLDDAHVPGSGRGDEIGAMAEAVAYFREGLIKARTMAAREKAEQARKEEEQRALRSLIQSFEGTVLGVLDGLSQADRLLRDSADSMTGGAAKTMSVADTATSAASSASTDVSTVASSAEELSSSIREIGRRVGDAAAVTAKAVSEAETSSREIALLDDSVGRIGEVVEMISGIASQTNLLALNATIEAARAGDAGKGFAVVANEVKALANQTAQATEDVSRQIAAVQSATRQAVDAIGRIGGIIREVDEISSSIAAAVEEQDAATAEIARSAEHTAAATHSVVDVMGDLHQAADAARTTAEGISSSSRQIAQQAATLKKEVREFLASVQAPTDDTGGSEQTGLVRFQDDHASGVPDIDAEHQKLMEMTNDLYLNLKAGREQAILDQCFQHLSRYTNEHFAGEEAQMERHGYPETDRHRHHHQAFVKRLETLYDAHRAGDASASMDLLALLGNWWRSHIETDDAKLAAYLRKQSVDRAHAA